MNVKFNFEPTEEDYEILRLSQQFLLDTLKNKIDFYKLNMTLVSRRKRKIQFNSASLYLESNPYRFKIYFTKEMLTTEYWDILNWFEKYPCLQNNRSDFYIKLYVFLHEFSHLVILLNNESLKEKIILSAKDDQVLLADTHKQQEKDADDMASSWFITHCI